MEAFADRYGVAVPGSLWSCGQSQASRMPRLASRLRREDSSARDTASDTTNGQLRNGMVKVWADKRIVWTLAEQCGARRVRREMLTATNQKRGNNTDAGLWRRHDTSKGSLPPSDQLPRLTRMRRSASNEPCRAFPAPAGSGIEHAATNRRVVAVVEKPITSRFSFLWPAE